MSDSSRKTSSAHNSKRGQRTIAALAVIVMLYLSGCGDFFAQKPTELQSQNILSDLSKISAVSDANIPVPDIYKEPPRILETKDGVKLFYFTKYHTVDKLSGLIKEQLGYKVSQSPATNQLIISCPAREGAETVLEFLERVDVPPIQVKIDCLVSELYADMTMDHETTILIENLFGEKITLGGKEVSDYVAFPGASLREVARSKIGLRIGIWKGDTGHQVRAMVDMLESRGYLKILMNPTLEVVNGETAHIEARDFVPMPKEVIPPPGIAGELMPYMTTEYQWVVDSLEITPHAFADGYIGLETMVRIASKSTPEGVKQIPIITERKVRIKENRIRHGDSLVIGGIRKSEKRDVVRGVPFLKDIPLLGILFSSRDFEERAKEVIFILTPTISTGGIPNEEMVEKIRRKREPPISPEGLHEAFTDPFGFEAREREYELEAYRAEEKRLQAESEKAEARHLVRQAGEQAEIAKAEAEKAMAETETARTETEKAQAETEKSRAETEKSKAETEKSKAETEKSKAETEKLKADAEKARAETDKLKAEVDKAKTETEKARTETEKLKADAEKAKAEAEKAKAEAEKAEAEAGKTEE